MLETKARLEPQWRVTWGADTQAYVMEVAGGGGGGRGRGGEGDEWEGACASLPQLHSVRKDKKKRDPFKNCDMNLCSPHRWQSAARLRPLRFCFNKYLNEQIYFIMITATTVNGATGHTGQCCYRFKTLTRNKSMHANGKIVGGKLCAERRRVATCRKNRIQRSAGEPKGGRGWRENGLLCI